jgi:RNA polymerase sigma factor (TIGR02999 family)
MTEPKRKITELLLAWRAGDSEALNLLMPLVYNQMHLLAAGYLHKERPECTIRTTDLVHEAYLKLLASEVVGDDRSHFIAIVAIQMRRVLVDHARTRDRAKRGGGSPKVPWDEASLAPQAPGSQNLDLVRLLDLDSALNRLAHQDPRAAKVVELLYFGDLTVEQIATVLGISSATVNRDLRFAKAWLRNALNASSGRPAAHPSPTPRPKPLAPLSNSAAIASPVTAESTSEQPPEDH